MFAGDSQTIRNKHHFVISVITINMFYLIYLKFMEKISTTRGKTTRHGVRLTR